MSAQSETGISLRLTPAQRAEVQRATGRDAETLEFSVRELEERVTPRLAGNHNETRLILDLVAR